MSNHDSEQSPTLQQLTPTETAGRSTIGRYQAQFRAAAYECLSILTGDSIDRVYCDYHDDYVARTPVDGKPIYHFYQVKTHGKRNHRWSKLDVFGLYKGKVSKPEKISGSFAGKLMFHTIRFNKSCGNVILLTNVHFDDSIEKMIEALQEEDFTNKGLKELLEKFNVAFVDGDPLDEESIKERLRKLILTPGISYVDPNDTTFDALAREAIFQYSEIDLEHTESEEIIHSLVNLVEKKSFNTKISELNESDFDEAVGVGISDLLEILSISRGAYEQLLAGGDPKAVRNASIIQRKLSEAGAGDDAIEYCSKAKVDWDLWLREKRHSLPEFDLNFLLERLNEIQNSLVRGDTRFSEMDVEIEALWEKLVSKQLTGTLTKDLLLGGVFSSLVRAEAQ